MNMETVTIPKHKYRILRKKAKFADDVLLQLESSFMDMRRGKVKEWSH